MFFFPIVAQMWLLEIYVSNCPPPAVHYVTIPFKKLHLGNWTKSNPPLLNSHSNVAAWNICFKLSPSTPPAVKAGLWDYGESGGLGCNSKSKSTINYLLCISSGPSCTHRWEKQMWNICFLNCPPPAQLSLECNSQSKSTIYHLHFSCQFSQFISEAKLH